MTDSLSDLSAGDSGSSVQELADGNSSSSGNSESLASNPSNPSKKGLPSTQDPNFPNLSGNRQADSPGSAPSGESTAEFHLPAEGNSNSGSHGSIQGLEISSDELTVISEAQPEATDEEKVTSLEGRSIGNFELKQFLGGGGMGIVFRAFDSVLSRSVAIKLLPKSGTKSEMAQRFQVEARSAARLDHPNISRVFQVGTDAACDYIIFEFVEGDNLSQLVRRIGPLPYDLALRYTFQLALAIQHAYQRGVVHRDIKPANVVVTDGGKLKLIDLGLARAPKANANDNSLTATGVMLGTYDYLSPEQAKDSRSADVRSDLYSLGCTVFFMLTGQPPYPQGTPIEKIIQHSSEKRPRPSDYRADLPAGFDTIISRLLAIDPADRYQRPAELIAEIQELASSNNIPLLGYDDNVVVKKIIKRPSWTMQLIPVLVPILLLLGFVFYLDWADRNSENRNAQGGLDPTNGLMNSADMSSDSDQAKNGKQSKEADRQKTESNRGKNGPTPGALAKGQESGKDNKGTGAKSSGASKSPDQMDSDNSDLTWIAVGASEVPEGIRNYNDLESALEAVNNDPRLNEIRIFRDSILLDRPVSVKVNQSLVLSSAGENESMILFRPEASSRSAFFKLRGGNIEFRNVHFRLETSEEMKSGASESSQNVATLIELDAVSDASFSGCSFTIDNFDSEGAKILSRARFISMVPARKGMAMFDIQPKEMALSKPSVTFRNFCIRGEADFMYLRESFPVTVSLNNGLCVSDGLLFDFGPAQELDGTSSNEIEVYLTRFTAIASEGIASMDAGSLGKPLPLRMVAKQSIFNYGNSTSFLQHSNLDGDVEKSKMLVLKCQDSFFPQKNLLWELLYQEDSTPETFDFNAMGDWLDVTGTVGDTAQVTWQSFEGLAIPPSEHTVFDYKLSGSFEKNPAIRREAGLTTETFLPIPPAFIE